LGIIGKSPPFFGDIFKGKAMEDVKIQLNLALINGILGYLGTRPYGEVFQLIQSIQEQAGPQVPVKPEETETSLQ
jgi:hypothetical protein